MSDRATYPPPSSMPSTRADSSQPQASPPSDESASPESSSRPTSQAPTAAEPLNPDATPQRIGRYRVARVLGRGGFGTVFLAHDDELRRLVAIKVPHRNLIFGSVDRDAYLAEARIVANLGHPNIVPVHDIGVIDDSTFFIVSKYIDGANLATRIRQSRLPQAEALELVATVAEALHY